MSHIEIVQYLSEAHYWDSQWSMYADSTIERKSWIQIRICIP